GESALAAFSRFVLDGTERLEAPETADIIETAARVVTASSALRAREREVVAQYTESLATLLAEEIGARGEDVEPHAVAAAPMGVQRALVESVRARVLAGVRGPKL